MCEGVGCDGICFSHRAMVIVGVRKVQFAAFIYSVGDYLWAYDLQWDLSVIE